MADPPIDATSVESSIKLHKVTDENHTFVIWETIFSNDANAHVLQDNKYKKLECNLKENKFNLIFIFFF